MNNPKLWTKNYIIICFINLVLAFGFSMLMPTMPLYLKDLGVLDSQMGLIIAAFTIASFVARPFAGAALDRFGHKKVFLVGLGLMVLSIAAYGWISLIWLLVLVRIFNGAGFGISTTGSGTIVSDIIPKARFGEGIGYFAMTMNVGMAFAPMLGLALMAALGYSAMTLIAAAMTAVALGLGIYMKPHESPRKTDAPKFSVYEKSAVRPSIITFFLTVVYGPILTFISLHAEAMNVENIGLFFLINSGALVFTRLFIGKLIDRKGFNIAAFPGFIVFIISIVLMARAETLGALLLSGVVMGISYSTVQTALQTMAVINAPAQKRGAANATFFIGMDAGFSIGILLGGVLASAWGYSSMFLSLSVSAVVGMVLYFLIARKIRRNSVEDNTAVETEAVAEEA